MCIWKFCDFSENHYAYGRRSEGEGLRGLPGWELSSWCVCAKEEKGQPYDHSVSTLGQSWLCPRHTSTWVIIKTRTPPPPPRPSKCSRLCTSTCTHMSWKSLSEWPELCSRNYCSTAPVTSLAIVCLQPCARQIAQKSYHWVLLAAVH